MHRSVHASVGILLALTACDPDPPPPPPPPDPVPLAQNQLQIMTWNVLFFEITAVVNGAALPGFAQEFTYRTAESSFNGLTYEDRAEEVAAGIRRANPDVVVLNEVFSDAARNILIDELEADYPHYVSRLAGNPPVEDAELASIDLFTDVIPPPFDSYIIEPLDSGLMLFSKVPFTPLPNTYDDATFGIEGWSNGPISSSYVAFLRYEDCTGLDCFSSKGAGLVALDTVGGPTYVAFSHMQAEDAADERWSQYNEVEDFLYEVIPNNDLASYPVYFAGDLNTPGGSAEWEGRFDPAVASTNFFACGNDRPCFVEDPRLLTDAWGFETSPDDAGPTSRGNNRLDYILHSHADNQLCMQHIRKPYEVRGGAGEGWFSDHRPVLADMNLPAQWCSPNLADPFEERRPRVLQFGPLDCVLCDQDINITAADGATLDHAGSFQWFVIDQEGSYSLRTISNHPTPGVEVDFDVYHHENLSQPLEPFRPIPDSHFGFTFPMYDPPYYIRTYVTTNGEPDRTYGNVEYQFIAHQHLCRSAVDACAIDPLDQVTHPWPDQTLPLVDVPEIWYRFKTASVAGGILADPALAEAREPDVSFLIDSSEAPDTCLGTPQVVDFTDPLAPGVPQWMPDWASDSVDVDEDFDDDGLLDHRWQVEPLPGDVNNWREYFVSIPRDCDAPMQTTTQLETTLTYIEPGYTECDKQFEDSGVAEDDHVGFLFTFDEGSGAAPSCEMNCPFDAVFDEDFPEGAQVPGSADLSEVESLKGYYVENFVPNLFEEEGDDDDPELDDERLGLRFLDAASNSFSLHVGEGLGGLPSTTRELSGTATFADETDNDDADYWYTMKFVLNHRGPRYKPVQ